MEGDITNPITRHRYIYGNNDPLNNIDPSGKLTLKEVVISAAIITALGAVSPNLGWDYMQDVYADLGEALFPDAFIVGFNLQFSINFPLLYDILNITWTPFNKYLDKIIYTFSDYKSLEDFCSLAFKI